MNLAAAPSHTLLRPMLEGDLPQILEIEQGAYLFPWGEDIFLGCLFVGHCSWILQQAGRINAYGIVAVAAGRAHILNLCVRVGMRRRGLGRVMLDCLLRRATVHQAKSVRLEVRPSNRAAICLYRSKGFCRAGLEADYYRAPWGREDALLFSRRLDVKLQEWISH